MSPTAVVLQTDAVALGRCLPAPGQPLACTSGQPLACTGSAASCTQVSLCTSGQPLACTNAAQYPGPAACIGSAACLHSGQPLSCTRSAACLHLGQLLSCTRSAACLYPVSCFLYPVSCPWPRVSRLPVPQVSRFLHRVSCCLHLGSAACLHWVSRLPAPRVSRLLYLRSAASCTRVSRRLYLGLLPAPGSAAVALSAVSAPRVSRCRTSGQPLPAPRVSRCLHLGSAACLHLGSAAPYPSAGLHLGLLLARTRSAASCTSGSRLPALGQPLACTRGCSVPRVSRLPVPQVSRLLTSGQPLACTSQVSRLSHLGQPLAAPRVSRCLHLGSLLLYLRSAIVVPRVAALYLRSATCP